MKTRGGKIDVGHDQRLSRALMAPQRRGESHLAYAARLDLAAAHHRAVTTHRDALESRHPEQGGLYVPPNPKQMGIPSTFIAKFVNDLVTTAANTPGGLKTLGSAVGHDTLGIVRHPASAHHFSHTAPLVKQMGEQTYQDFRHPLRHPGNTFLSGLGLASLGAGTAVRGAAFAGGLGEAGTLGERLSAAGRAAKAVGAVKPRVYERPGPVRYSPEDSPASIKAMRSGAHRQMVEQNGKLVPKFVEDRKGFSPSVVTRAAQRFLDSKDRGHPALLRWRLGALEAQNAVVDRSLALGRGEKFVPPAVKGGKETTFGRELLSAGGQGLDALNQTAVLGHVLARGAYMPNNYLGNMALLAIKHKMNPVAFAKSTKLYNATFAEIRRMERSGDPMLVKQAARARSMLGHAIGQGGERSLALEGTKGGFVKSALGVPAGANRMLGDVYQRLIDQGPRGVALAHEAQRLGFTNPTDFIKLLTHEAHGKHLERAASRARRSMVDFSSADTWGLDKAARRTVFVYPWVKGSAVYGADFIRNHPVQAGVSSPIGELGGKKADQQLLRRPSFAQGIYKVGERNMPGLGRLPLVQSQNSTSPFGTPLSLIQAGTVLATGAPPGNVADTSGTESVRDFLNPVLDAGVSAITGRKKRDISTRGASLPGLLAENLFNVPLVDVAKAALGQGQYAKGADLSKFMYPRDAKDAVMKFSLGGLWPSPYNPQQGQAKYRAEVSDTLYGPDRVKQTYRYGRQDVMRTLLDHGLVPHGSTKLPPQISKAFSFAETRKTERARLGGKPTALQSFEADLETLSKLGVIPRSAAEQGKKRFADLIANDPHPAKEREKHWHGVSNKLWQQQLKAMFGGNPLLALKHDLEARGITPPTILG